MADQFEIRPIWDDSQFKQGVMDTANAMENMETDLADLQKAFETTNKKAVSEIDKSNKKVKDQEKALNDAGKEGIVYSQALEKAADQVNILGVNLGGTIRNLKDKKAGLTSMITGLKGGVKGLKAFKIALASTGIGAIVVLLGSLVAWLTKTQEGLDKVEQFLAGVSAAASVFIDRAAKIGGALIGWVTGQKSLTEAWAEGKEAVSGLGAEIAKEAVEAAKLTGQLQKLKRSEEELNVKRAESRAEIKELNKIAEDTTKSDKERADAAQKAIQIEQGLANERKQILEQQLQAQKALDDQGNSTFEDLQEQRRLRIEIGQAEQETLELQTTLQNKLNTIQDQRNAKLAAEAARISELRDRYAELLETVTTDLEDFEANTPFEKARLSIQRTIEQLQQQKEEFRAVGEASGKAIEEIEQGLAAFDQLEGLLQLQLTYISDREQGDDVVELIKKTVVEPLENDLDLQPSVVVKVDVDTSGGGLNKFKDNLLSGLGISEDEAQQIIDSVKTVANEVTAAIASSYQARIEILDAEIEKRQENRENLEEELEQQEELEAEGFANKAEATRAAIEEEVAQEEKAIEERDRLRRKEQQLQEIVNLAQQVSALITAGAQIFSAESSKGVVGVGLAIAAIAGMLASFATLKANAKKATKLYTGTERIGDHIMHVGHKSDRTGKGYQIHDGDTGMPTGVFIGGDEALMEAGLSREHRELFRDMHKNPETYRGLDMVALAKGRKKALVMAVNNSSKSPNYQYIPFVDPKTGHPYYIEKTNGKTTGRYMIET